VKVSNVSLGASERDIKEFFSFSGKIEYVEMQRLVCINNLDLYLHFSYLCYTCLSKDGRERNELTSFQIANRRMTLDFFFLFSFQFPFSFLPGGLKRIYDVYGNEGSEGA